MARAQERHFFIGDSGVAESEDSSILDSVGVMEDTEKEFTDPRAARGALGGLTCEAKQGVAIGNAVGVDGCFVENATLQRVAAELAQGGGTRMRQRRR